MIMQSILIYAVINIICIIAGINLSVKLAKGNMLCAGLAWVILSATLIYTIQLIIGLYRLATIPIVYV